MKFLFEDELPGQVDIFTLQDEINGEELYNKIEDKDNIDSWFKVLVPSEGKADTVAGELIRAMMRILYRDYNDGDRFFSGYGVETCGGSAQFLIENTNDWISNKLIEIAEDDLRDDAYTDALNEVTLGLITFLKDNKELLSKRNEEDSRDWELDEGFIPKYDFDCEIPPYIQNLIDSDKYTEEDLESELYYWEVNGQLGHEADRISVNGRDIYIEGIPEDTYEELERNMYRWLEDFANDLYNQYGDEEEWDDEDNDEDEEYLDEALENAKYGIIETKKFNNKNFKSFRPVETLEDAKWQKDSLEKVDKIPYTIFTIEDKKKVEESLHNDEIEQHKKLTKEIGVKTLGDLKTFKDHQGSAELDALKDYKKELDLDEDVKLATYIDTQNTSKITADNIRRLVSMTNIPEEVKPLFADVVIYMARNTYNNRYSTPLPKKVLDKYFSDNGNYTMKYKYNYRDVFSPNLASQQLHTRDFKDEDFVKVLEAIYEDRKDKWFIFDSKKEDKNSLDLDEALGLKEDISGNMTVEEIAEKHKVPVEHIRKQLEIGVKVEKEHIDDRSKAERIALDHLFEIPNYYDKLDKMEKDALKESNDYSYETIKNQVSDKDFSKKLLLQKVYNSLTRGEISKTQYKELVDEINSRVEESLKEEVELDEISKLAEEINDAFEKENSYYDVYPYNGRLECTIERGDWKHDHLYFEYFIRDFLENKGYVVDIDKEILGESEDDSYSASYTIYITKDNLDEKLNEGINKNSLKKEVKEWARDDYENGAVLDIDDIDEFKKLLLDNHPDLKNHKDMPDLIYELKDLYFDTVDDCRENEDNLDEKLTESIDQSDSQEVVRKNLDTLYDIYVNQNKYEVESSVIRTNLNNSLNKLSNKELVNIINQNKDKNKYKIAAKLNKDKDSFAVFAEKYEDLAIDMNNYKFGMISWDKKNENNNVWDIIEFIDTKDINKAIKEFKKKAQNHIRKNKLFVSDFVVVILSDNKPEQSIYLLRYSINKDTNQVKVSHTHYLNKYFKEYKDSILSQLNEKLIQGKSDATLKKNIATEIEAGKDPKQAYAIAKSVQKKNESLGNIGDTFTSESNIYLIKNEDGSFLGNDGQSFVDSYFDALQFEDRQEAEESLKDFPGSKIEVYSEEDFQLDDTLDESVQKKDIKEDLEIGADFYGTKIGTEEADDLLFGLQAWSGQPKYNYKDFIEMNLEPEEIQAAKEWSKKYNKFTYFEDEPYIDFDDDFEIEEQLENTKNPEKKDQIEADIERINKEITYAEQHDNLQKVIDLQQDVDYLKEDTSDDINKALEETDKEIEELQAFADKAMKEGIKPLHIKDDEEVQPVYENTHLDIVFDDLDDEEIVDYSNENVTNNPNR